MSATTADRFEKMKPFGAGSERGARSAPATSRPAPAGRRCCRASRWSASVTSSCPPHRRYGDAFTVRVMPKGSALVLFTGPEHIKEIFAGDPEVFHAGKGNAILGPIMGEHSLLLQTRRAQAGAQAADARVQRRGAARLPGVVTGSPRRRSTAGRPAFRSAAGPDERPDPRGDHAGGLRRHRRGAPRRLRPLVSKTVNVTRPCCSAGAIPSCSGSALEGDRREPVALDEVMYAEIAERRGRPTWPRAPTAVAAAAGTRATSPVRRRAARPARHPAARRSRDHGRRAVLGALRARPRPGAAAPGAATRPRHGDDDLRRGRDEGVDRLHPVIPWWSAT